MARRTQVSLLAILSRLQGRLKSTSTTILSSSSSSMLPVQVIKIRPSRRKLIFPNRELVRPERTNFLPNRPISCQAKDIPVPLLLQQTERDRLIVHLSKFSQQIDLYLVVTRCPKTRLPASREDAIAVEVIHGYLHISVRPDDIGVYGPDIAQSLGFNHDRLAYRGILPVKLDLLKNRRRQPRARRTDA